LPYTVSILEEGKYHGKKVKISNIPFSDKTADKNIRAMGLAWDRSSRSYVGIVRDETGIYSDKIDKYSTRPGVKVEVG